MEKKPFTNLKNTPLIWLLFLKYLETSERERSRKVPVSALVKPLRSRP